MNTIVNMSFYIQKSLPINTKAITIDSLNFIESTKCVDESKRPQICVGSSKSSTVFQVPSFKFLKICVPGPNGHGNRMVKTSNFQKPFLSFDCRGSGECSWPEYENFGKFQIFTIRFIAWKMWKF